MMRPGQSQRSDRHLSFNQGIFRNSIPDPKLQSPKCFSIPDSGSFERMWLPNAYHFDRACVELLPLDLCLFDISAWVSITGGECVRVMLSWHMECVSGLLKVIEESSTFSLHVYGR